MVDLDTTANSIVSPPAGSSKAGHAERLEAGRVHQEFDEDDHVFDEDTQVPRRRQHPGAISSEAAASLASTAGSTRTPPDNR